MPDPYVRFVMLNKEIEASVKRGEALFAATFVACAWFLSVPVEIRRTPICPTKFALEKRIGGCIDLKDWASLVSTHYSTCSEKKTCSASIASGLPVKLPSKSPNDEA